jgi:hypothetical protein
MPRVEDLFGTRANEISGALLAISFHIGITNMLALPLDKMLYIYLLFPHSEHQKIRSNLNSLNSFTKETSSNKVKLAKVGSNAIVPVPVRARPDKCT